MTDQELGQIIWDYLRYEQPLEKSDIIIGFGCHDIGVARYVASLYQQSYAPLIMFCGGVGRLTPDNVDNEAEWYADEAKRLGVPEDAILKEGRSTNTGENIAFAYELLQEKNVYPRRIILVHTPYSLRRDYAAIMKQWPGEDRPEFIFSAEQVSMDEYVRSSGSFESVVGSMIADLRRVKEYPELGFQIEQEIPENVWSAYEELVGLGYTSAG